MFLTVIVLAIAYAAIYQPFDNRIAVTKRNLATARTSWPCEVLKSSNCGGSSAR